MNDLPRIGHESDRVPGVREPQRPYAPTRGALWFFYAAALACVAGILWIGVFGMWPE